jgi:hypothetical protein
MHCTRSCYDDDDDDDDDGDDDNNSNNNNNNNNNVLNRVFFLNDFEMAAVALIISLSVTPVKNGQLETFQNYFKNT